MGSVNVLRDRKIVTVSINSNIYSTMNLHLFKTEYKCDVSDVFSPLCR